MNEFLLYGHGGCENHGCEAIIRSTVDILNAEFAPARFILSKQEPDAGIDTNLDLPVDRLILQNSFGKVSVPFLLSGLGYLFTEKMDTYYRFRYKELNDYLAKSKPIALSIGGDNYCYGQHNSLYYLDWTLGARGCKKVLWGCSIEPKSLEDAALVEDLDSFDLIVGREPITVNALKGALKKAKVVLHPDPAFALQTVRKPLPEAFKEKGIVGVNVSPTVSHFENGTDMTFVNYDRMIRCVLEETDHNILLIPHVTWAKNNDLVPLTALYEKYKDTGRVMLVEKFEDCRDLKGYIAQCDMFVGARTHSTIAAYSSYVPCVVVGYSVKADGIATQLFGTTENYVVPSQKLTDAESLAESFRWLDKNRVQIKAHLEKIMPDYIASAFAAAKEIRKII